MEGNVSNDVWCLDVESMVWENVHEGGTAEADGGIVVPAPRTNHVMCRMDDVLVSNGNVRIFRTMTLKFLEAFNPKARRQSPRVKQLESTMHRLVETFFFSCSSTGSNTVNTEPTKARTQQGSTSGT